MEIKTLHQSSPKSSLSLSKGVDESAGEVEKTTWRLGWKWSGGAPVAFTLGCTAGTQDQLFVVILSGSGRHYKYIPWKPKLQHIVRFPELLP